MQNKGRSNLNPLYNTPSPWTSRYGICPHSKGKHLIRANWWCPRQHWGSFQPAKLVQLRLLHLDGNEIEDISVVAKRVKRSEGLFFQMLYQIHKIITLIFTGKNINFGNYSCLTKNDVKTLSKKESLWCSFSGSIKKHILNLNTINSIRGLRYFGPSKMPLFNLIIHSLSIIAVFKNSVFVRSIIFAVIIYTLKDEVGFLLFVISMILLIVFSFLVYLISFRENIKAFLKSDDNVASIKNYTH